MRDGWIYTPMVCPHGSALTWKGKWVHVLGEECSVFGAIPKVTMRATYPHTYYKNRRTA